MTSPSNGVREFPVDAQRIAPAATAETRPFYWSVRREIWENRSIYIAPLIVAGFVLWAASISLMVGLPKTMRILDTLDPARQHQALVQHLSMAPAPIMFTTFLVAFFYCLDALYGERRDRSILFWKSMPVSDRTVVFSKAAIPLVVLPLIGFLLSVIVFYILFFVGNAVLVVRGLSPARFWAEVPFIQLPMTMFYGLAVHALWFAPVYGWLLLISAWAKRAPILWAVLPPMVPAVFERMAFGTTYLGSFWKYRFTGAMQEAFYHPGKTEVLDELWQLTLGRFLSSAGLWFGLLFAGVFLAAAVRLRRNREPI